jgi:O-antigen ligase
MPGDPYATLLAVHAAILCALAVLAIRAPRGSRPAIALAAALYNAVPISPVFGMATPVFLHDVCVPLLALAALHRPSRDRPLLALCALAALLWPAIGTAIGLVGVADPGESAQFVYRRVAFVVFFGAGLSGVLDRAQLRRFLDAGLLVWVGMAMAGLLQYGGVIDTDLGASIDPELRGRSIVETIAAARGFMGLNRGAVGVWGSAEVAYAFAMLAALDRPTWRQLGAYGAAAAISIAVLFLSGSRTGIIAVGAAVAYTAVRLASRPRRALRVVGAAAAIAAFGGVVATGVGLDTLFTRFSLALDVAETGQQRVEVQQATLAYVLRDVRALSVGMGQSVEQFRRLVGDAYDLSHTHSEYVDILWHAGVLGLVLYGAFVAVLFRRLRSARPGAADVLFAGRSMLVAGLVAGVAVGNIFVTEPRLAPFSLLMAFVYGALANDAGRDRGAETAPIAAEPLSSPTTLSGASPC